MPVQVQVLSGLDPAKRKEPIRDPLLGDATIVLIKSPNFSARNTL